MNNQAALSKSASWRQEIEQVIKRHDHHKVVVMTLHIVFRNVIRDNFGLVFVTPLLFTNQGICSISEVCRL